MKREGSLRTSPSCRSYYVAVRRGECDEGWPATREGQEIPLPTPASRNHRVFDADQCADLQSAILYCLGEALPWCCIPRGIAAKRMQGLEELRWTLCSRLKVADDGVEQFK